MTYSKRILWPIGAAVLFVAGCSSGSTDSSATPPATTPPANASAPPATMPPATTAAATPDGAALFTANCAKCHGPTGKAPKLAGMHLAVDEVTKTVTNGKGKMPPFKDRLKSDEIGAIAKYVSTL